MVWSALGALILLIAQFSGLEASGCSRQRGCCDGKCWEKCFDYFDQTTTVDQSKKDAASRIYQALRGIRALHGPCHKPHGTAYMLDSDVPPTGFPITPGQVHDFQRNLATMVAITQPVSNKCNPFFVNKYHRNWAWYAWSWPCKDRCEAAAVFSTPSLQYHTISPTTPTPPFPLFSSWVGGGCILANSAFNNGGLACSADTRNELMIAFANSEFRYTPRYGACNAYKRAVIGTNPHVDPAAAAAWADPGPFYHLPADDIHRGVSYELVRCMNNECCPNHTPNHFPARRRRSAATAGNDTTAVFDDVMMAGRQLRRLRRSTTPLKFGYSTPAMKGKVKSYKGSFTKFKMNVLQKLESGSNPGSSSPGSSAPDKPKGGGGAAAAPANSMSPSFNWDFKSWG